MTNIEYFEYSKNHLELMFDDYYSKDIVIIPSDVAKDNDITLNNSKLIENISAFNVLRKQGKDYKDDSIKKIVDDVISIMISTPAINYSAFSQYFMVYNTNYSMFKKLSLANKKVFMYEMLDKFCENRHEMYLSHGYSSIVLQVMCDNYSHKRNSKTGINKIEKILRPLQLENIDNPNALITDDRYIFLPDKGGSKLFKILIKALCVKMQSRESEHNKLPDVVFKYNNEYYICELKTMKEGGGGQDKQVVEIANFIRYQEKNPHIHYISFLDGLYYNEFILSDNQKMETQRVDIEKILMQNPQNYFFNTESFIRFITDIKMM